MTTSPYILISQEATFLLFVVKQEAEIRFFGLRMIQSYSIPRPIIFQ